MPNQTRAANNPGNPAIKLTLAIATLAFIGILRTVLEVKFKIFLDEKWFSYDRDILFVMAFYPIYLCFFTFMCLHVTFGLFQIRNTGNKLITFLFFIQFVHLLIPVLDYIGFRYNIPYNITPYLNAQSMSQGFSLNPFSDLKNIYCLPIYFTPLILLFTRVTTLGINIAWLMTGIAFFFFLRKELKIAFKDAVLIILLGFQTLYWPIYKYYFVFDGLFNKISGTRYFNHYGYGMYFFVFGLIGLIYFLIASQKEVFRRQA